jgi:hypothetical protein
MDKTSNSNSLGACISRGEADIKLVNKLQLDDGGNGRAIDGKDGSYLQ